MAKRLRKHPKYKSEPKPTKTPKAKATYYSGTRSWRFSSCDREGPFAWLSLNEPDKFKAVVEQLYALEGLSENDLRQQKSHFCDVSGFSQEAQKRLADIQMDDLDQLFSLRISGKERIWCRVDNNVFHVLWWDPEHRVYPSVKKHT